jgi:hypothetical protein
VVEMVLQAVEGPLGCHPLLHSSVVAVSEARVSISHNEPCHRPAGSSDSVNAAAVIV